MSHPVTRVRTFPFEERDQWDSAEAWYNDPLRSQNRTLSEENQRLKKLLRQHGIPWSSTSASVAQLSASANGSRKRARVTRSSMARGVIQQSPLPTLPVEVQLQIMELSLTSNYAIIDPLSKLKPGSLTQEENQRGNQIAIGFLATCKAYHVEGARFLWKNNRFTFTSHHALRNFANLHPNFRKNVKGVTLRVIAKYYDDERKSHSVSSNIAGTRIKIKCAPRIRENTLARKGYKSYSWLQLVDFLDALRPPFDPFHHKKQPRPRLFPNLASVRIDFINFPRDYLMYPDHDLHRLAAHDLGCSIEELMVTGLPRDERGRKAMLDLTGMVRDDGLLIKAQDTFIQQNGTLRKIDDCEVVPKIIRPWKLLAKERAEERAESSESGTGAQNRRHYHSHDDAELEPVTEASGHPESEWKKRRTIWKRIPLSRDSEERKWSEFSRTWGGLIERYDEDIDEDDSDELVCGECGEVHDPLTEHDF